jgi:hypothetical protein
MIVSSQEDIMRLFRICFLPMLVLAACSGGNVRSSRNYHAPKAPPLLHPYYDPYAPYGSARAVWTPPVASRDGTIVRPQDETATLGRPDYEHAPWATGAAGGSDTAPPGTF